MGRLDDILPAWPVLGLGGVGAIALAGWYASTAETVDELLLLTLAPLFLAGGLLFSVVARPRHVLTASEFLGPLEAPVAAAGRVVTIQLLAYGVMLAACGWHLHRGENIHRQ